MQRSMDEFNLKEDCANYFSFMRIYFSLELSIEGSFADSQRY